MIRTALAARCARIFMAAAILAIGADIGAAAATAFFAKSDAASQTYILAIDGDAAAKQSCREVVVETDEGYGVRGKVTRTVCEKSA
jgi:hypothetical protein